MFNGAVPTWRERKGSKEGSRREDVQRSVVKEEDLFTVSSSLFIAPPYRTGRLRAGVALNGTASSHEGMWYPRCSASDPQSFLIWRLGQTSVRNSNGTVRKSRDGWSGCGQEDTEIVVNVSRTWKWTMVRKRTNSCEGERRVGWPARGQGENRDSGENSRRSALKYAPFRLPCAFHGAPERNHTSTCNLPSLAASLSPLPHPGHGGDVRRTFSFDDSHGIKIS